MKVSVLILLAFATAFFPRIFSAIGIPSIINFLHFAVVPFALGIAIVKSNVRDRKQISIFWEFIVGLSIFLVIMVASALLNGAGFINVFLDFLLLAEPFMLPLAIVCLAPSTVSIERLKRWLFIAALINLFLALAQFVLISAGVLPVTRMTAQDNIQGVFYLSGAGNYVSVAVSISFALYYFTSPKPVPFTLRVLGCLAAFYQLLISDSKQVLLAFIIGWILLSMTKVKNIGKFLISFGAIVIVLYAFFWLVENVDFEGAGGFKNWIDRMDLYTPDGEGTQTKLMGIGMVLSHYDSPFNWLFGLGPGHTIGRLGGWVLKEYASLLLPLGATTRPIAEALWDVALNDGYLSMESSLFVPLFSWVGIWGDLGFVGLGAYLYLWSIVWNRLCLDDFSRFIMLSALAFGFFLTQMEEPGQMLSMTSLIALRWQEHRLQKRDRFYGLKAVALATPQDAGV